MTIEETIPELPVAPEDEGTFVNPYEAEFATDEEWGLPVEEEVPEGRHQVVLPNGTTITTDVPIF